MNSFVSPSRRSQSLSTEPQVASFVGAGSGGVDGCHQHVQARPSCPELHSDTERSLSGVVQSTRHTRMPLKRAGGRVAALASQFQQIEADKMKGRNPKKFSSIAERIEVYTKATSGSGTQTAASSSPSAQAHRPPVVRAKTSAAIVGGPRTQSASTAGHGSPSGSPSTRSSVGSGDSVFDRGSASRIPTMGHRGSSSAGGGNRGSPASSGQHSRSRSGSSPSITRLLPNSKSESSAESSPTMPSTHNNSNRSGSGISAVSQSKEPVKRVQSATTSISSIPSPQSVKRVNRQMSEPVKIRSPKLVHTVSPIFRSSPSSTSTPPLPKSSPPMLPESSPPITIPLANATSGTPPLPKAPIPNYSPSSSHRSSPRAQRKESNLTAVTRHATQPTISTRLLPSIHQKELGKSKSTSEPGNVVYSKDDAMMLHAGKTSPEVTMDVLTELMPSSRTSSGKSPIRRDSGCESSESTNGSPELHLSPPSSTVASDSVFGSVNDRQDGKTEIISASSSGSSLGDQSSVIELQQVRAERDHLQLVLKNTEMMLYAAETERDALVQKNNDVVQEVMHYRHENDEQADLWTNTKNHAVRCVIDGRNFFLEQESPTWHTTMVQILDEALMVLDGTVQPKASSATCSSSVRESLQRQLETVSRQLEETRRERRSLQEKSSAWDRERRELQNEVFLSQHKQSTVMSQSDEALSMKDQRLRQLESKCQLLEHEKDRETKQVTVLSTRKKTLEGNLENARQQIAQLTQMQNTSHRNHEGELSILRNTIKELKREKMATEATMKKEIQKQREQHDLEVRSRDFQIKQMEDETDELTMQVQKLEERLSGRGIDSDDSGKGRETSPAEDSAVSGELEKKVTALTEELKVVRTTNADLQAKVVCLEATDTVAPSLTARPMSSRELSPSTASRRNFSPRVVRGQLVSKTSAPSPPTVQRTIPAPTSLTTASSTPPTVNKRQHPDTKPATSADRHTFSEFGSQTQKTSDSEQTIEAARNQPRFGRYLSSSSASGSSAATPGSPLTPGLGSRGSSPNINHWKTLQNTVKAKAHFQTNSKKVMLLEWCKIRLNSYEGVHIQNFHRSWRNGLAFCALLHYHAPQTIAFDQLDPDNIEYNLQLAFDEAEKLGIASLLDVCDMVSMETPEWHSVMTYVSSIYNHFNPKV